MGVDKLVINRYQLPTLIPNPARIVIVAAANYWCVLLVYMRYCITCILRCHDNGTKGVSEPAKGGSRNGRVGQSRA